jgi:serine O-acetyltransferase
LQNGALKDEKLTSAPPTRGDRQTAMTVCETWFNIVSWYGPGFATKRSRLGMLRQEDIVNVDVAPSATNTVAEREPGFWELVREDRKQNGGWHRPGSKAMFAYRFGAWSLRLKNPLVRRVVHRLSLSLLRHIRNAYGIELYATATIGRRFSIGHQNGIVIHEFAIIGDDCAIHQGVTMGQGGKETFWSTPENAPRLGNHVDIGANAVIIGKVTIGDNARIFPNSLIMSNVPANATMVTAPARAMPQKPVAVATDAPPKAD